MGLLPLTAISVLLFILLAALKKSFALFFCALAFSVLYVGQAYFMSPNLIHGKVYILDEYGYALAANNLALIYLISLFTILLLYLLFSRAVVIEPPADIPRHRYLECKLLFASFCTISIYLLIIGFDGLSNVRPNMVTGGTFGTILVVASSILSLLPVLMKQYGVVTFINIASCAIILIASGTRIFVLYFLFVVASVLIKRGIVNVSLKMMLTGPLAAFLVLIVGQSIKEYYGENIVFESLLFAIEFTIENFYNAQTEAFVSFASSIQYFLDKDIYFFNIGLTFFDGIKLLLPGFLKPILLSDHNVDNFRFYNFSIIPSAANDLFQSFFIFGIIFHVAALILAHRMYRAASRSKITNINMATNFIVKVYICGVLCVIFTRGPLDLLFFNIIPVWIVFKILLYLIFNIRIRPQLRIN